MTSMMLPIVCDAASIRSIAATALWTIVRESSVMAAGVVHDTVCWRARSTALRILELAHHGRSGFFQRGGLAFGTPRKVER